MKKKTKLFTIIMIIIMVVSIIHFCFIKDNSANQKQDDNLTNITECSQEFMNNYFEETEELQDNKENILIVTSREKIEEGYGASEIIEAPNNQYILQYDSAEEKETALEEFNKDEKIVGAEENIEYTLMETETYKSWGIEKTGLDQAIKVAEEKGLNKLTVATIDSGCDMNLFNQYFSGKIEETYDAINPGTEMTDTHGHGTSVAGIIAEGTSSNVKILPVKVLSSNGKLYNSDIIAAINYIVYYNKADVINMSFGTYTKSEMMLQAINSANAKNIICVAAAGNDNTLMPFYPAAFDNTISVAACDENLDRAEFSNYGSTITFSAPGVNIASFNTISTGTSMAAPHVTSAIAILKSYNKNYTLQESIEILKSYAVDLGDKGRDNYFGNGMINLKEISYCSCECENCNSINCENCECENCIFNETIVDNIKKMEIIDSSILSYNYGSITNLSNIQLKIYEDNENYSTKYLFELDDYEIIGYNPYCYTEQTITIKYQDLETSFELLKEEYEYGWEYEIIDSEHIKLTKFKESQQADGNPLQKIYIPQTIDGYNVIELGEELFLEADLKYINLPLTVTEIGPKAFYSSQLEKIDIQSEYINIRDSAFYKVDNLEKIDASITTLGDSAFYGCTMLNSVKLDTTLEKIGANAFWGCNNLESIVIPENVTNIGAKAFYNTYLKNIIIPDSVLKIEEYAFSSCINLETVVISKNLIELGDEVFSYCINLNSIYIPENVTSIGNNVFLGCTGLQEIIVDEKNQNYDSRGNCNALIDSKSNILLKGVSNTIIPNTVKVIGFGAFAFDMNLKEINIPEGVEEIHDVAFFQCRYLTKTKVPKSVKVIGYGAFGNINNLEFWVYKDSYAKTYAIENDLNYKCIDPSDIIVHINKTEYKEFEKVDSEGLYLELDYDDGRKENIDEDINIKYINENDSFRYGDTHFTVSAYSQTGIYVEEQVPVTVEKIELETLEVKNTPIKQTYYVGDLLDITGLVLLGTDNEGNVFEITEGYTYTPEQLNEVGIQTITVTYEEKTTTFTVTVEEIKLDKIEVKTSPQAKTYYVEDTLDTTGLVLLGTNNNGTTFEITEGYTYTPEQLNEVGIQTITVTYEGKTTTFTVTVIDKALEKIEVKTKPTKLEYYLGETVDTTDLVLLGTNDNGSTFEITEGYTYTPQELNEAGTQIITVTYNGKNTTYSVTVVEIELDKIEIKTKPEKLSYYVGENLDTTGMELLGTNNDGSTVLITDGYTTNIEKLDKAGEQQIQIIYGTQTTTITVLVKEIKIEKLEIIEGVKKTQYYIGETLSLEGLKLKATYNNGDEEIIENGYKVDKKILTEEGKHKITITYKDKKISFDVDVIKKPESVIEEDNKNDNKNKENNIVKDDDTIVKGEIPKAGNTRIIKLIILALVIISIVSLRKYKDMKNI